MKSNLFVLFLGFLMGFALFYLIFGSNRNNKVDYIVEKEVYRDTVVKMLPRKEIKIKVKPKIQHLDTIFNGFTFSLDTLISKDTVNISYSYPENSLFLRFAAMPDTFRYERTILNISKSEKDCLLQDKLLYAVSGVAIGLIIAKIK